METRFSPRQLADPALRDAEAELRRCVHCGFCTATCPTYVLLGDEADSPRGRIYLIKELLETGGRPSPAVTTHLDRCLSCLSCNSTCPSGVDYRRLIDTARVKIAGDDPRPLGERLLRRLLMTVLPRRRLFRAALFTGRISAPLLDPLLRVLRLHRLRRMLALMPARHGPRRTAATAVSVPARGRVVLLQGCVEDTLRPQTRAAAGALLARMGYEVVEVPGEGCCGAIEHHLGNEAAGRFRARNNVARWQRLIDEGQIDAVLATASGCASVLGDYAHWLREDPAWAAAAATVSARVQDLCAFIAAQGLPARTQDGALRVAWQSPCSMQHGLGERAAPRQLLQAAGFDVLEPDEAHLCCGSAGVYNILQPALADELRDRKRDRLLATRPDLVASANIGCISQLGDPAGPPVVHIVELLDWATGGAAPVELTETARTPKRLPADAAGASAGAQP